MSKFPIYEDDVISVEGEMREGFIFLHADFKGEKFTKAVYSSLLSVWLDITEALKEKKIGCVFSCIPKDTKIMKWQGMFGMSPIAEAGDNLIYGREL